MEHSGTSPGGRPAFDRDTVTGQGFRGQEMAARYEAAGGEGIGALVSGLIEDLQELLRGEIKLARTEVKEDIATAARAAAALAAGAIVGLTGFIILMLGVAYLLNEWLDEMWLSAGIVGLALGAVAAILVVVGKNKLSAGNLKPEQTIASLKEDKEWAKQQISSVGK